MPAAPWSRQWLAQIARAAAEDPRILLRLARVLWLAAVHDACRAIARPTFCIVYYAILMASEEARALGILKSIHGAAGIARRSSAANGLMQSAVSAALRFK